MNNIDKINSINSLLELNGVIKSFPLEENTDFVDKIRDISGFRPPVSDPELRGEIEETTRRYEELRLRIITMTGNRSDILDELIELTTKDSYMECRMAFREGLREGFRLAQFFLK